GWGGGGRGDGSCGSLWRVVLVTAGSLGTILPSIETMRGARTPRGGSSMKGMNLSGKPGMVQPMQIPPTLGQPPMPAIQPRLVTLQLTTGPQQPILTRHSGEPYSLAKSPCS